MPPIIRRAQKELNGKGYYPESKRSSSRLIPTGGYIFVPPGFAPPTSKAIHYSCKKKKLTKHFSSSSPSQNTALFKSHPHVNMFNSVQWQITNHPGFIPAFISSIRYAPLSEQQATWKRIGLFLSTQTASPKKRWQNNKVLVIAGSTDPVILPKELKEDIDSLVGEDFFQWEIVEGGHDFPSVKSFDTAKIIAEFWEL